MRTGPSSRLLRPQGAVASHRDYAARAVRTEEKAERALAPSLADSFRRFAKSYWTLARQQTEMKHRPKLKRTPNVTT